MRCGGGGEDGGGEDQRAKLAPLRPFARSTAHTRRRDRH